MTHRQRLLGATTRRALTSSGSSVVTAATGILMDWYTGIFVTGIQVDWYTGFLSDWYTGGLVYWVSE